MQSAVCVTTEGGRSSHQQGGECEGGELYTSLRVRGLMGRQCEERTAAREAVGGRMERWEGGGAGAKAMEGDGGALVTALTLTAGAAGRMVRRMEIRCCTLLVRRATARW